MAMEHGEGAPYEDDAEATGDPVGYAPSSLAVIEEVVAQELDFQQSHFESLDTKAGIVLGFAGALVALSINAVTETEAAAQALGTIAIISAGLSASIGLLSFWPREFQVLDVSQIRDDALGRMLEESLRVALLDTSLSTLDGNRDLLHTKAKRLKISLGTLLLAVILLGAGIVVDGLKGSDVTETPDQQNGSTEQPAETPSSEAPAESTPAEPVPSEARPDWITTIEKGGDPGGEKRSD